MNTAQGLGKKDEIKIMFYIKILHCVILIGINTFWHFEIMSFVSQWVHNNSLKLICPETLKTYEIQVIICLHFHRYQY